MSTKAQQPSLFDKPRKTALETLYPGAAEYIAKCERHFQKMLIYYCEREGWIVCPECHAGTLRYAGKGNCPTCKGARCLDAKTGEPIGLMDLDAAMAGALIRGEWKFKY